jgi:hypothetical protein
MTPPPTWIDPESWAAFHESRRKLKAPLTPYAERLIIGELVKLKCSGHDPQKCLDQSIMLGWRDVFPLRDKGLTEGPMAAERTKREQAEFAARPATRPSGAVAAKIASLLPKL